MAWTEAALRFARLGGRKILPATNTWCTACCRSVPDRKKQYEMYSVLDDRGICFRFAVSATDSPLTVFRRTLGPIQRAVQSVQVLERRA
jgi:hypothetical protein